MKRSLLTGCLLLLIGCCFSQDRLITRNKDTITAFIIKEGPHSIIYTLPGDSSSRQYRIGRRWIRKIDVRTQTRRSFRERARENLRRSPFEEGNNLLASGIKRFGMNDGITAVYISYERRFFFNRLSAVIAPQIALGGAPAGGAVGIRYFPNPYARVNFFVGNDLLIWNEDQRYYNMERLPDKTYITRSVTKKINRGGLLISTGCRINTGKKWSIAPELGWGLPLWKGEETIWKDDLQYNRERMLLETVWQAQIGIGYRF